MENLHAVWKMLVIVCYSFGIVRIEFIDFMRRYSK